ncbi:MAG: type II toxin-antitoxin system VapC family toxin [Sporichthyaceae bacterium]
MIVLDASFLIAYLSHRDAHHARAAELMGTPELLGCTASEITWAEVLVSAARAGRAAEVNAALAQVVEVAPLPEDAHVKLAVLRAETGLKMPDCCAILVAESTRSGIATFDGPLAKAGRARGIAIWD